jgi:hypothetical protein
VGAEEGDVMKFLVSWRMRTGGSAADNEAAAKRGLALFEKWAPPEGTTFHQFLQRLDGEGGYAVVEADDPLTLAEAPAKFGTMFEFSIVPVADIMDVIAVTAGGIEYRDSIT